MNFGFQNSIMAQRAPQGGYQAAAPQQAGSPGPGWVQIPGGGWVPPDHPLAQAQSAGFPPESAPLQPPLDGSQPMMSGAEPNMQYGGPPQVSPVDPKDPSMAVDPRQQMALMQQQQANSNAQAGGDQSGQQWPMFSGPPPYAQYGQMGAGAPTDSPYRQMPGQGQMWNKQPMGGAETDPNAVGQWQPNGQNGPGGRWRGRGAMGADGMTGPAGAMDTRRGQARVMRQSMGALMSGSGYQPSQSTASDLPMIQNQGG